MDQVAGIHSILLNGQPVAGVSPDMTRYEIGVDTRRDRNVLVLEMEPPATTARADELSLEWGSVALLIRPIDPAQRSVST
jgi:hypothetical protein